MTDSIRLSQNYHQLEDKLRQTCIKYGRKRDDITLVAVSKFHPAGDIAAVAENGQVDFGENYVQEALEKQSELKDSWPNLRWHMIGHVQSRKAAQIAGNFALVHSLDSEKLADAFEKKLAEKKLVQRVLIEVNIADEPQKSGIMISELENLARHVMASCPSLKLEGLMCLPPVFDSGMAARPYFAKLRQLRDSLSAATGLVLAELSMGMSGDFEAAIAEGASIVRIGTDIFGPRPVKIS